MKKFIRTEDKKKNLHLEAKIEVRALFPASSSQLDTPGTGSLLPITLGK